MLKIESIEVENFGPFKGNQRIDLPDEDGVTVVFGDNMRGKTMLLNSIRFALFGRVLSRGSREISPQDVINWESKEEGNYSFQVTLSFKYEDDGYELVRSFKPAEGVVEPRTDEDYTEEVFLRKNGVVLGPQERDQELTRIMPEQVSRFFLFDGELLQQYEQLLVDESEMGRRISEAIETILGLPVLTNARADLRHLREEAEKDESAAAQREERTQELGNQLEGLTERRSQLQDELDEVKEELESLQEEKSRLEEKRRRHEKTRSLIEDKQAIERELETIEGTLEAREEKLQEVMSDSWKGVLNPVIRDKVSELREKREELSKKQAVKGQAEELSRYLKEAADNNQCPICSQELDGDAESHIQDEISSLNNNSPDTEEINEEFGQVASSIQILERLESPDPAERIGELVSEIDQLKADKAEKEDRISSIEDELSSSKEEEAHRIQREYDEVVGNIKIKREAISETEEAIEEASSNIKKLQRKLDQESDHGFTKERRRREIYEQLYELFDDAVDIYRDQLRERVEKDATRIFLELTTEPEYERLRINESYGLTIIHEDGDEIPVRSAGAEHVVALSLMGALQNNAPLQGPIIMDSPFGRLDENHVSNVVEALPEITDQIILLVYRSELSPDLAREILKGKLRAEYSMARESARHTNLVKGGSPNE